MVVMDRLQREVHLMSGIDRRTAAVQDEQNCALIKREGGVSLLWLVSNRDHAASLHRLIASGRIRIEGSGWIPVVQESPRSVWDGLREWAGRVKFWLVGGDAA
jgi:hypothetical protein